MNAFPPMISPRFQVSETGVLQYKPYPAYPIWLDAWDVGALVPADVQAQIDDINAAIAALSDEVEVLTIIVDEHTADINTLYTGLNDANGLIVTAQLTADNAQTDATTALANAAAAQSTADDALAASGVADKTIERFADSAVITGATPSIAAGTQYRYNYVRFTTVLAAIWKWFFVADLSAGASITVLYEQGTGQGTVDLKINGVTVASKDFSSGGTVNNQTWTATLAASIHGAGRHTLELVAGGAGSVGSGFAISLHKVWINAT